MGDWYYLFQISKAISGADRKDLMRKLPKFIYDEEKALEVGSLSFVSPKHIHYGSASFNYNLADIMIIFLLHFFSLLICVNCVAE